MRLEFVELAGFRGFRDKTRFELPSGFIVISGRNGTGKSTLLDAVDFALTGTINKYSVTSARGGGLSEHIWWVGEGRAAEHHVSVGFVDDTGTRFVLTRTRDKGPNLTGNEILARLCAAGSEKSSTCEALMQTTLVRDELISALSLDLPEQARFAAVRTAIGAIAGPDHSDRTEAILREARSLLPEEEGRAQEMQAELGRALGQLTEARTDAERSSDIAEALRVIDATVRIVPGETRLETVRGFIADRKAALTRFNSARVLAAPLAEEAAIVASGATQAAIADADSRLRETIANTATSLNKVGLAEKLDDAERFSDQGAAHFAALVEHGEALGLQHGHCPLCDSAKSDPEFAAAIAAIRNRLAERGKRLAASAETLRMARAELTQHQLAETEARSRLAGLSTRLERFKLSREAVRQAYQDAGFGYIEIEDIKAAEQEARNEQQKLVDLERALLILGASGAAERITTLEVRIGELRRQTEGAAARVANAEKVVETARQIDNAARTVSNEISMEQFDTVMPLLKELYRRLRPHTDWTEINSDFGGKIRGSLNFTVGDGRNPQFLFSSGQRRAAGLAFLLAVHLSRPWCLWRSLLLDDPVQHIDDYRALNLVEVLAAIRRSGRQMIVAVEDAALADLLCRRLRSTATQPGRRYDLRGSPDGAVTVETALDILPMSGGILRMAAAS